MSPSPRSAPSQPPPPSPAHRRYRKDARLAQLYESDIVPLWSQRFGRLLAQDRRDPPLPPKATVLEVLCGTGTVALDLLSRTGDGVRVVAIDPSPPLLDVARKKAADAGAGAGRRLFFRSESAEPTLSFDRDVFDLVLSNLGLWDVAQPRRLLHEMVRVAKPGARVAATLPLIGTFAELYDLFGGVLSVRGLVEAERRLRSHISTMPSALEAKSWLVEAGLQEVRVDCAPFTLLFAGGRELFLAPLIEYGPLSDWKEVVGQGAEMQEVFWQLREAVDESLQVPMGVPQRPFALTVRAGCLSGRKPPDWEGAVPDRPQPPRLAPREPHPDSAVVELNTGEIDILSMIPKDDPRSS